MWYDFNEEVPIFIYYKKRKSHFFVENYLKFKNHGNFLTQGLTNFGCQTAAVPLKIYWRRLQNMARKYKILFSMVIIMLTKRKNESQSKCWLLPLWPSS